MATTISFLLRPLCVSTSTTILSKYPLHKPHFSSFPKPSSLLFSRSLTPTKPKALTPTLSFSQQQEQDQDQVVENEIQGSDAEQESEMDNVEAEEKRKKSVGRSGAAEVKLPELTVKERKELASYAHSLGKKLVCQIVGKNGVTDNVVACFIETLESNELLKIKILGSCPGQLEDVVKQLEEATGSVVVGQIGRTVIVYRPSLMKLKLEEKKKQARRVFVRRGSKVKPSLQKKAEIPRLSGRGRRGSSRFPSLASS